MTDSSLILVPVGWVSSPLVDRVAAPRQGDEGAPDAWIVVDAAYESALDGIRAGDRLVILTLSLIHI